MVITAVWSDWRWVVLRACRDAFDRRVLLGGSAPRCGLRPGLFPVPAIFFPAAAPLLAQQQDRHTQSSAYAAA